MKYRRVRGSGFLCMVYMVFVCVVFTGAVRDLCERYMSFQGTWDVPLTAAGCVLVLFLVSVLMRSIFRIRKKKQNADFQWWEWLIVFLVVAAAVFIRVRYDLQIMASQNEVLQMFFIPVGIISIYPALRVLFGRVTALFVVACASFFLQFTKCDFKFVVFCFLILLMVWLFVRLCDSDSASWPIVVMIGMISGVTAAWNPVFLAVFLLGISGIMLIEDAILAKCRGSAAVIFMVSSAAGSVMYVLSRMFYLKEQLTEAIDYLAGWWVSMTAIQTEKIYLFLPLTMLYIFGWDNENGKKGVIWLLPFLLLNCHSSEEAIWMLGWIIMAGLGIQSMICETMEKDGMFVKKKQSETEIQSEENNVRALLPGEPIPNPLAGPRKHVRKEMDYAFIPEDSKMCFDIEELEEGMNKFDIE